MPIRADFALTNACLITMDASRRIVRDGALAVAGNRIVWVGRAADLATEVAAREVIDGSGFVVSPGFINAHVHVTGDPLTRHFMADDVDDPDPLMNWVIPRYHAHFADDEKLSATLAAVQLLKGGTTTFIEAGTIRHLAAAVEGLDATGIRGRVGIWVEGRSFDPTADAGAVEAAAIRSLENEIAKYPSTEEARIAAWPILVGHSTNTDAVWCAAKTLADANGLVLSAHMSPYPSDPAWYLANTNRRPLEHLADIGVLGENTLITHATHVDESEVDVLAQTGTRVAFCPYAAIKGAYGVTSSGRYAAMRAKGVPVLFGTDGDGHDFLPVVRVGAGLMRDLAGDPRAFNAMAALEAVTCGAADALGLGHEIGSLEAGKKADFVCFDATHAQWRPLTSPVDHLVWAADARSVHSVYVDGRRVVSGGAPTQVDEAALLAAADAASGAILARSGLPFSRAWPTV